jgi:hypothetical protein
MSEVNGVAEGQARDILKELAAMSDEELETYFAENRTLQVMKAIRVNRKAVLDFLEPELSALIDSRIIGKQSV